jgi:DNA adenine methylase
MKTPITYYGGKQRLLKRILPLIPPHRLYAEPFAGREARYSSPRSLAEIGGAQRHQRPARDLLPSGRADFKRLRKRILATLHSRDLHKYAGIVYAYPHFFSKVDVAWSVWTLSATSFAASLEGTFGYDKTRGTMAKRIANKKGNFTDSVSRRLQNATIESRDALETRSAAGTARIPSSTAIPPTSTPTWRIIRAIREKDFERLLEVLSRVKGRFLLSSYPSEVLSRYRERHGWYSVSHRQAVAVHAKAKKQKEEVLTANYPIDI